MSKEKLSTGGDWEMVPKPGEPGSTKVPCDKTSKETGDFVTVGAAQSGNF